MSRFRIAICQLKISGNKAENLDRARRMMLEGARQGAKLVVLPEMFNCPYDNKFFHLFSESYPGGETIRMLRDTAREGGLYLVGGSIPELEGDTVYNTSFIFNPAGELIGKHRKAHLFDVELASGLRFMESETLGAGNQVTMVKTELAILGIAICYDIRFPEMARLMALAGAQMIVVPAAFNMTTGPAHWEALFRIRAVDNQVFMVGAAPARDPEASYVAYGNSLVVEPWGEIITRADEKEQLILADIDLGRIAKVRQELPLLSHRRTDLYELVELKAR